jgi:hypothetical protein
MSCCEITWSHFFGRPREMLLVKKSFNDNFEFIISDQYLSMKENKSPFLHHRLPHYTCTLVMLKGTRSTLIPDIDSFHVIYGIFSVVINIKLL